MSTSTNPGAPAVPPGWNPDPADPFGKLRWWDGTQWTDHTRPAAAGPGQPAAAQAGPPAYVPQQQAYSPPPQAYAPQQQAPAPAWPQPPAFPGQAPPLQAPGGPAALSGQYRLRLSKVTSMIFVTTRRTVTYTGTYEQLQAAYKKHLIHNRLLGWWGIPWGLIRTPMSLSNNARALRELKALAGRS